MPDLTQNIIVILLTLIALLTAALYIWEVFKKAHRSSSDQDQLSDQTRQKSYQVVHQAIKKAQNILGLAEIEGLRIVASTKVSSGKLDQEFEDKLSKSITSAQQVLTDAEAEFIKYLDELKSKTTTLELQTQQAAIARINQLFSNFESRITDFLVKTESQTTQSIQLELRSTRQLIETYKSQQLTLIDENIMAMMEQTLASVLGKKLSLKDQLDLVYEALEKAKIDKFIV